MFPHVEIKIGSHAAYPAHDIHEKFAIHFKKAHGEIIASVMQRGELKGQDHDHIVAGYTGRVVEQFKHCAPAGTQADESLLQVGLLLLNGQQGQIFKDEARVARHVSFTTRVHRLGVWGQILFTLGFHKDKWFDKSHPNALPKWDAKYEIKTLQHKSHRCTTGTAPMPKAP